MAEYIKREDAFDVACAECEEGTFYDIPSKIEAIPSADVVEHKRGTWIEYPECLGYEGAYCDEHIVCSVCGDVWNIIDNDADRFNFCPNCGADMRSAEGE